MLLKISLRVDTLDEEAGFWRHGPALFPSYDDAEEARVNRLYQRIVRITEEEV